MLNGIDISSWQGNINLAALDIDFVIVKATEGVDYVNPYCDPKIQQAEKMGLLWGFYHYMKNNDPVKEADFFIRKCENYFGFGIPVLDWEEGQSVESVNKFVRRVHDVTGVWCWIYANPWRFNQGGVEPNCGRWVASYPTQQKIDFSYEQTEPPYTDGLVCCWQFTSNGKLDGYNGNLDLNRFYGSKIGWQAYAETKTFDKVEESKKDDVSQIVVEDDEYRVVIERKE